MAIPNLPSLFQKIAKGSEGGLEFARVMNLLMVAEGKERAYEVIISSDSSGDFKGVDSIIKDQPQNKDFFLHTGLQYKFFPSNLTSHHKNDIKKSLLNAIEKFPEMKNWIIVTPEDFSKKDMEWLESIKAEYQSIPSLDDFFENPEKNRFEIFHWGHTNILSLMLKHPEIAKHYYNELFSHEIGNLVLSKVSIDSKSTNWYRDEKNDNLIIQKRFLNSPSKTSELIFDFQFINNSRSIHHLHQIDIVIEDVWNKLKGIPSKDILKSIGTMEIELDFDKPINCLILDEVIGGPMVFKKNESKRFGIQLKRFTSLCPGNMAKVHFEFHFNSTKIQTDSFTLDFVK